MFKRTSIHFITNVSAEDLVVKLKKITKTQSSYPSDNYIFRGSVNRKHFRIYTLPYTVIKFRMTFELEGSLETLSEHQTSVHFTVKTPVDHTILLLLAGCLNLGVIAYLFLNPIENGDITWKLYAVTLPMMIAIYGIARCVGRKKIVDLMKRKLLL